MADTQTLASQHLSVLTLNTRHPDVSADTRDLCRMHSRIVDATVGMPESGPRALWATPTPDMLVIRAAEPVTAARLPAGYATHIKQRLWEMPTRPGRYRVVAVLNPGRLYRLRDVNGKRRDAGPAKQYDTAEQQAAWFARRLACGGEHADSMPDSADVERVASIADWRVVRTWMASGRYRERDRKVVVRCVAVAAVVDVHDPQRVQAAIVGGLGRDKTWGCGLTIWEPIH